MVSREMLLIVLLLFPKPTKQGGIGNCVKGKTYRSAGNGMCMACPPTDWTICYHQAIQDRQRCVDSCRGANPSSSSKLSSTSTPTTSSFPALVTHSLEADHINVKEVQKEDTRSNGQPDENLGLIIAISSLAVFLAVAIVVGLVFAIRSIRRKSRRGRVNGNDDSEDVPLRDLARNEQRNEANDANQQLRHEPNRADERALEANDMEQRLQEQNNEEERDGGEQHLQAVQETQDPTPPFQATPSTRNICGVQDSEDDFGSSSLHLTQIEN